MQTVATGAARVKHTSAAGLLLQSLSIGVAERDATDDDSLLRRVPGRLAGTIVTPEGTPVPRAFALIAFVFAPVSPLLSQHAALRRFTEATNPIAPALEAVSLEAEVRSGSRGLSVGLGGT